LLPAKGHIETSDLRNDQKDSHLNDQKDSHLLEMVQRAALVAEVGYSYLVGGAYYSGHSDVVFRDRFRLIRFGPFLRTKALR
jgi:hypothetical protein